MALGEDINPLEIYERDEWTCGICTKPIDRRLRRPSWWCATLDHIRPMRCFESAPEFYHTRANLQASHWKCNMDKGDTLCEDEMAQ